MSNWLIFDMLTNVSVTGSQIIATSATGSDSLNIGDFVTNAKVNTGELCVESDGTFDRYLTYGDKVTNIALNSSGSVNVNDSVGDIDHYALLGDIGTNIPLDASGRLIIAAGGTNSTKVTIGDSISNVYRDSNSALIITDVTAVFNNRLLESGDDRLLESGYKRLLG